MFCQHCGAKIDPHAHICLTCGCLNPENSDITTQTRKSNNNTGLIALILLLMLGVFGAHRFYMKKTASAVGMLLLFWGGYFTLIASAAFWEIQKNQEIMYCNYYNAAVICLACSLMLAWTVWYIIDIIQLCTGRFKDTEGNTIKL